jgi:amino acid transporter
MKNSATSVTLLVVVLNAPGAARADLQAPRGSNGAAHLDHHGGNPGPLAGGNRLVCRAYHIGATPPGQTGYSSVLSQIVAAVAGKGPFYYVTMAAVVAVLCLSANTSFADFPGLCRVLALDQYLPAAYAERARRLVYSHGILLLAAISGSLIVAFGGVTDHLIPLFAIGALLAFTMSQLGMVFHWARAGRRHWRKATVVNAFGTSCTAVAVVIMAVTKFKEGAWITVILLPSSRGRNCSKVSIDAMTLRRPCGRDRDTKGC